MNQLFGLQHRSGTDPVCNLHSEPTPCVRVNLKVVVFIACCVPAFVIKGGALFS